MILLLDMDGPLADFDRLCWALIEARGWSLDILHPAEQTERYITNHMIVPAERRALRKEINSAGWFESLPVTPGAVDGVAAILDAGHQVWVCTKPLEVNPTCRDAKAGWLREHFPMLERKLIIAPDKTLVLGHVLLDDAPPLDGEEAPQWKPVAFTMPFNGVGSFWEDDQHWTWGDPIEELFA